MLDAEKVKETLNLPQTSFPMKAKLSQKEPEIIKKWEKMNLYQKIQKKRENSPTFILHDGPPYANGNIHLGTALNKILKDFIVKTKNMQGFKSPYLPGWEGTLAPIQRGKHIKNRMAMNKAFFFTVQLLLISYRDKFQMPNNFLI